jgi:DNA-binding MarR family transcriptional regulator
VRQPADLPPPGTRDLRLVHEVSFLMLAMAEQLQDHFAAMAAGLGLTAAQAKVLIALEPHESLPMRALADRLGHDPSNLTGLVDKLEARGAVVRRPDNVDRRVKALTLTEDGLKLRATFWDHITHDAGPFAHLSRAELRVLRDGLRTLRAPSPRPGRAEGAEPFADPVS